MIIQQINLEPAVIHSIYDIIVMIARSFQS